MSFWLLLIPFISAVVAWVVNTCLIRVVFLPLHQKKILGITFQGIIPKYQQIIANQIAKFVISTISFQQMEEKLTHPDTIEKIMPFLEEEIDNFLRIKLPKQLPMISMFIGDNTIAQLKAIFVAELRTLFPQLISNYIKTIESNSTFEILIAQKIASIDPILIETTVRTGLKRQFQIFQIAGAFTGFLIGLFQIIISFFLS